MSTPSTKSQVIMAHIFCVAQQFTSVTVYVLGKKIMATVDVQHFVFIRLLFVIPLVFLAAALFTRKLGAFRVPWKPLGFIAASGVIGLLISQTLAFAGLDKSTATNASIISAPCTPLFTAIFSVMRGSDKMNIPKGFGFLSSMVGALLLLQVWNFEFKGTTMGNLLIVGSAVCNALNSIIQKQVLNGGYHPLVVQAYVCSFGMVSYLIGYSGFGLFEHDPWVIPGNIWVFITVVGIVATALPWCVSIIALKHTSPMTTSVYVVLQPLIAGFIGVVLMGEVLTWVQMMGSALVILGLLLVNAQPIIQRIFYRTKVEFALLPTEETKETQDTKEIELTVIVKEDHCNTDGDTKPTEEVSYELTPKGETNAFVIADEADYVKDGADYKPAEDEPLVKDGADYVIADGADYTPVEVVITPEIIRSRHQEKAEGENFSVTLHKPTLPVYVIKDGADYTLPTDYYGSSCKMDIAELPTPTLRPVV